MTEEVRVILRGSIKAMMDKYKMTWYSMNKDNIVKELGCPVSDRTLFKIAKDDDYNTMLPKKQSELLTFFLVPHVRKFGIIELSKNNENEHTEDK